MVQFTTKRKEIRKRRKDENVGLGIAIRVILRCPKLPEFKVDSSHGGNANHIDCKEALTNGDNEMKNPFF